MPELGLSLLIECINIGCRDDVVEVVFGQKMRIIFQIALFRISLMDKMVILSGNWIYAWRGLNLSNTFALGRKRERKK